MKPLAWIAPAAALAALLTAAPAFAGEGKIDHRIDQVFARLDVDHDGRVSRAEVEKAPRLANHFDKVDADRDGFVTRAELRAAIERRLQRRQRR